MDVAEYHKLADVEDRMWYFRALHAHIERALDEHFVDRRLDAGEILDAGCGTGGLMRRLQPRHAQWRWTGIDASEVAVALAQTRVGDSSPESVRPTILRGSVEALPFANAAFDAVVSADVLYHVDDDAAAVREFHRVLRPGGVLVVNVPAYRWLWSYHDTAVHSRRRYGRAELVDLLSRAGLALENATHWNTVPFPLIVARRKLLPPAKGGSDVQVYPAVVEAAFDGAMAFERGWLKTIGRLPFGSSIFAVARKPR